LHRDIRRKECRGSGSVEIIITVNWVLCYSMTPLLEVVSHVWNAPRQQRAAICVMLQQ